MENNPREEQAENTENNLLQMDVTLDEWMSVNTGMLVKRQKRRRNWSKRSREPSRIVRSTGNTLSQGGNDTTPSARERRAPLAATTEITRQGEQIDVEAELRQNP